VIGRRLNVPVAGKTPEEATAHFGWFAQFAAMDREASSERTGVQHERRESNLPVDHQTF